MAAGLGVASPLFGGDGRPLVEPGSFFVDGNYALRVNSWCSLAGVVLTVRSRFLSSETGVLVDSVDPHTPNSNRTIATVDIPLAAGFPLNVMVFASSGAPLNGQCFVQVLIVRGRGAAATPIAVVLQGYVTATKMLGWPGSPIVDSTAGQGFLRSVAGTTPGAGVDITETVPSGARWGPISFQALLVTSVTVASRTPILRVDDGVNIFGNVPVGVLIAASTTINNSWAQGVNRFTEIQANTEAAPMPTNIILLAASRIRTATVNLQAGDQWSQVQYLVQEWLEAN
jgi:hypothetical protein